MSYRFEMDEPVVVGLRRIALEQIDKALDEMEQSDDAPHKAVHQARKRCKKIRGLARLVRPSFDAYKKVNREFRDTARTLADFRDATARLECYEEFLADDDDLPEGARDRTRELIVHRRDGVHRAPGPIDEATARARERMAESRRRVEEWELSDTGFDALGGGLKKSYRRGRKAMRNAYEKGTPEAFHEWRKRAKYHWYHCRLLRDVWKPTMETRIDEVKALSDFLGDHHDLAVLGAWLAREGRSALTEEDLAELKRRLEERRRGLETRSRPLGRRLFAEKPKALVRRVGAWWEVGRRPV